MATSTDMRRRRSRMLHRWSVASFVALLVLTLVWELWIAPLRPGGSWLALKAVPLLFPVKGIVAGRTYTYRWAVMLVLAYVAEGCVRAYSDPPPASILAVAEIALAAAFFFSAIAYLRTARNPSPSGEGGSSNLRERAHVRTPLPRETGRGAERSGREK